MANKNTRNSSVELLRIISIYAIVLSHVVGSGKSLGEGINEYLVIFQNSFVQAGTGVTCFMLITGYFGNKFSSHKLISTWSLIWVCSVFSTGLLFISGLSGKMELVKSLLPVITKKYWYASCYIFVFILSPWLNKFTERLSKKELKQLLIICIGLFYIIPTIFYFEIMEDKGKGLVHMIIAYMLGRYIRNYIDVKKLSVKKLWLLLFAAMSVTFIGNIAATLIRGQISWPFSRECTITILCIGVILVLLAVHTTLNNPIINKIAVYVFPIYLLNGAVISLTRKIFDITKYYDSIAFLPLALLKTFFICSVCLLIALFLKCISAVITHLIEILWLNIKKHVLLNR